MCLFFHELLPRGKDGTKEYMPDVISNKDPLECIIWVRILELLESCVSGSLIPG